MARRSPGRPHGPAAERGSVVTGYPEEVYRRAGRLLGAVDLPSGKRPDAVDALVVPTAAVRHAAAIAAYTSALDLKMEIIRV